MLRGSSSSGKLTARNLETRRNSTQKQSRKNLMVGQEEIWGPSSEIPPSYLEDKSMERPLCCGEIGFSFVDDSIFCPPLPIAPYLPRHLAVVDRYLHEQTDGSIKPGPAKAPGKHIDALDSFARIWEATLCHRSKITRTINRSVGCWLGKEAGKVGIRILIKLQSASFPQSWNT